MSTKQQRTRGEDYQAPTPVPREKRRRGRPESWSEEWIGQAAFMARHGATDVEMARELGCTVSTFYLRMNQYPEFSEAVKEGKAAFDQRVTMGLARRAIGYEHETEKVFANGARFKVVEHVPPDTTAQIFWLKNRDPERWRDKRETEIVVPVSDEQAETLDARTTGLAMLALLNEALYTVEDEAAGGPLLDMTANAEENDDGIGFDGHGQADDPAPEAGSPFDPDFDLDV